MGPSPTRHHGHVVGRNDDAVHLRYDLDRAAGAVRAGLCVKPVFLGCRCDACEGIVRNFRPDAETLERQARARRLEDNTYIGDEGVPAGPPANLPPYLHEEKPWPLPDPT